MRLPFRLAALAALASPAAGQPAPRAAVVARIDSLAGAPVQQGAVAGLAVFVVRGGDTLVARGYGRADVENDVPMTVDHVFQLASITKQFTAAAVLQLVEEGKVDLDAPITRYLPQAPVQGRTMTVRQLLSHTAGIADYADVPTPPGSGRLDAPSDSLLALVRGVPPYFEPGTQLRYSNTGYALAGQLIEKVTGRPYAAVVEERVLRRAGLARTHFCTPHALVPRIARGYAAHRDSIRPAEFISPSKPWAAGGFCGTARDIAHWNGAVHARRGGAVLAPASYDAMVRPATVGRGRVGRYALGVMLDPVAGRRARSHAGDITGFTTFTTWLPDDSLNVTVLVNTQGPTRPDLLTASIVEAVLGPAPARPPRGAPSVPVATLAGRYADGVVVEVASDGAGPAVRVTGGPLPGVVLRYAGEGDGGPVFADDRARLTFEGARGRVTALWADFGVALVRWAREAQAAARDGAR
jgi:CubicO group peptidase (beta-lactamase class C family)